MVGGAGLEASGGGGSAASGAPIGDLGLGQPVWLRARCARWRTGDGWQRPSEQQRWGVRGECRHGATLARAGNRRLRSVWRGSHRPRGGGLHGHDMDDMSPVAALPPAMHAHGFTSSLPRALRTNRAFIGERTTFLTRTLHTTTPNNSNMSRAILNSRPASSSPALGMFTIVHTAEGRTPRAASE